MRKREIGSTKRAQALINEKREKISPELLLHLISNSLLVLLLLPLLLLLLLFAIRCVLYHFYRHRLMHIFRYIHLVSVLLTFYHVRLYISSLRNLRFIHRVLILCIRCISNPHSISILPLLFFFLFSWSLSYVRLLFARVCSACACNIQGKCVLWTLFSGIMRIQFLISANVHRAHLYILRRHEINIFIWESIEKKQHARRATILLRKMTSGFTFGVIIMNWYAWWTFRLRSESGVVVQSRRYQP